MLYSVLSKLVMLLSALVISGCNPTAIYSEQAYLNSTTLKARTLAVMELSGEPFETHADTVEKLNVDLSAAFEFANGLPGNEIVSQQWQILIDPDQNLAGGFLERWEMQGTTDEFFRSEAILQVGAAFDIIICLEVNKLEPRDCGDI